LNYNLFIDGDSLIYKASYNKTDLQDAIKLFNDLVFNIINEVSEVYPLNNVYLSIARSNSMNKRYSIFKEYKAQRKEKPELVKALSKYLNTLPPTFNCQWLLPQFGEEVDDEIANRINNLSIIAHIDKDLNQLQGIHYNYNNNSFYLVDEEQAYISFYSQFIIGDTCDNIKTLKGKGEKFAKKVITSKLTALRIILNLYQKEYGESYFKKFKLFYRLFRLGNGSFLSYK
jgi:5'-3' exonuclease